MPTISARWDIKSLIEHYANIQIVGRPATVRGVVEYHSNCPWCGGTDRFVTRPDIGQYSCAIRSSGCGRVGDSIDFLKEFCDMTHAEALEVLDLEQSQDFIPSSPPESRYTGNDSPPCKGWVHMGMILVERAAWALWNTSEGRVMLDYLHGRGLKDDIIKKKQLGFVPLEKDGSYYKRSFEDWGLDPEQLSERDRAKGWVRVPSGILIPWFVDGSLQKLALKRPGQDPSYGQVMGSKEGLYNVDSIQCDQPCMMVEAEFCSMAVEQESGDFVSCVATGSSAKGRSSRWIGEIGLASFVLQSFDDDHAGDEAACYWTGWPEEEKKKWIEHPGALSKCMRWSPMIAKDPNDLLQGKKKYFDWVKEGYTLREWVEAGLQVARVEFGLSKPERWQQEKPAQEIDPALIPLARGDLPADISNIQFHQASEELKASVLEEYKQKGLQIAIEKPPKPTDECSYCKKDYGWTWSSQDNDYICLGCLSPSNWSQAVQKNVSLFHMLRK